MLNIEVAYASSKEQVIIPLQVNSNCTVNEAIHQSGILNRCPEINLDVNQIGIYSRKTTLSMQVNNNDRVEIYRPLLIDPKQARRKRAA